MNGGRLICVEGIDGAGKTTLVNGLVAHLNGAGMKAGSLHLLSLFERDLDDRNAAAQRRKLTDQERAFVSYSRLYDFYLTDIVPALESYDVLLLDRYKWSYLVRWACRNVRWSVLTALGSMNALLPEAMHTILLSATPVAAYRRKVGSGIVLTPAETDHTNAQSQREAFLNLQERAAGYYDDLFSRATPGSATRIDSMKGEAAVLTEAIERLRQVLAP